MVVGLAAALPCVLLPPLLPNKVRAFHCPHTPSPCIAASRSLRVVCTAQ